MAALCFDRMGKETRREAPAGNSHARKRVVTDDKKNRSLKGRHMWFDDVCTASKRTPGIRVAGHKEPQGEKATRECTHAFSTRFGA